LSDLRELAERGLEVLDDLLGKHVSNEPAAPLMPKTDRNRRGGRNRWLWDLAFAAPALRLVSRALVGPLGHHCAL
jgi:hypothetical protein